MNNIYLHESYIASAYTNVEKDIDFITRNKENALMDIRECINMIRRRLWIIIVITVLFTISTGIYNYYYLDNIYESNTTLYIGKPTEEQTAIAYNDLLIGQNLVKDYREIANSRIVSEQVVDELIWEGKLDKEFNPENLADMVSVNLRGDTRVIEIKVQDTIPERTRDLANKLAKVFKARAQDLMKIDNIEVIDEAVLPAENKPVKPERIKNIAIAVLFGIAAGFGLILLIEYFDNTIKTSEDVEKYLELPVIGSIPKI